MKERPFIIIVIGYIIGILWGLYFKKSIVLFYFIFILAVVLVKPIIYKTRKKDKKLKLISFRRYIRYVKLVLNKRVILLICIISIISNTIVLIQEKNYNLLFKENDKIDFIGIVLDKDKESSYFDRYICKIIIDKENRLKAKKIYINVPKKYDIRYGDRIKVLGKSKEVDGQRNYRGFSYSNYLKVKKICGIISVEKLEVIEKSNNKSIYAIKYKIKESIRNKIKLVFNKENQKIIDRIVLGEKEKLDEEIEESFKITNISHILSISGMHINYIISGIMLVSSYLAGKRKSRILTLFILSIYIFLVGFSTSLIRASVMSFLLILSKLLNERNDTYNSLGFVSLITLIYNPYEILDIGFQLSYFGTLGVILFYKSIKKEIEYRLNRIKYYKYNSLIIEKRFIKKIIGTLIDILSISMSVQIFTIPIIVLNYNIIGLYSIIVNIIIRSSNRSHNSRFFFCYSCKLFFLSNIKDNVNIS